MRNILVFSLLMITTCPLYLPCQKEKQTMPNDSVKPDTSHSRNFNGEHSARPRVVRRKASMPELFQYRKFLLY